MSLKKFEQSYKVRRLRKVVVSGYSKRGIKTENRRPQKRYTEKNTTQMNGIATRSAEVDGKSGDLKDEP